MEGSIEKFNNADVEANEASELELSDKLMSDKRKNGEKYQVEIKGELVDLFEENYFNTMSEIDRLADNISDDDFRNRFGFDMSKLRKYVDGMIPDIMGKISVLSKENKIFIEDRNSVRDVLSNSLFGGLATVEWFKKNINSDSDVIQNKINNPKSLRRKSLESAKKLLDSDELEYYFNELCSNENRLKMEVKSGDGFISRFSDFFNEGEYGKIYPSGSKKLPYFKFFSEADKWRNGGKSQIKNRTDFRRALDELDPSEEFIIKDEVRKYFLDKK